MTTSRAHISLLTVTDQEDGHVAIFCFGHDCPFDQIQPMLTQAIGDWLATDDALAWAQEHWPLSYDWLDCLNNIPDRFLEARGLTRLDTVWGYERLDPNADLVPAHLRARFEQLEWDAEPATTPGGDDVNRADDA